MTRSMLAPNKNDDGMTLLDTITEINSCVTELKNKKKDDKLFLNLDEHLVQVTY